MTVVEPPPREKQPVVVEPVPVDRDELEALVEALIEEARRRARRRRRRNTALILVGVAVGAIVWSIGGQAIGSSPRQTATPKQPLPSGNVSLPVPLTYSYGNQVFVVSRVGSKHQLTHDPKGLFGIEWSPDGSRLLAYRYATPRTTALVTIDRTGRLEQTISSDVAANPALSPDGTQVAYMDSRRGKQTGTTLFVRPVVNGHPRIVATGVVSPGDAGGFSWSPDGRLVYVGIRRDGLYIADANRHRPPSKIDIPTLDRSTKAGRWFVSGSPAWSPDGRWVAVSVNATVYVVRPDGSGLRNLGSGIVPAWSPDSTRLAYVGFRPNDVSWVVRPDGTGRVRLPGCGCVLRGPGFWPNISWSPDGTRLAFVSGKGNAVTTVGSNGAHPVRVASLKAEKYGGPTRPLWQPQRP